MIKSLIDTDLYKLSQQNAVLFGNISGVKLSEIPVKYEFINRGKTEFPEGFSLKLRSAVEKMALLHLSPEEKRFLSEKCPFLRKSYLDYLTGYTYNPAEVSISQNGPNLSITVTGPWSRTILWEVPLMAIVSELYFKEMGIKAENGWRHRRDKKASLINRHELLLADFGTRRRFSWRIQNSVVNMFARHAGPTFIGTSNVQLAMRNNVKPIGTMAHEFCMALASLFGYRKANYYMLEAWTNEFQGDLGIALTDTFTTDVFFKDFNLKFAKLFNGIRWDSGDAIEFINKAVTHYKKLGIDSLSKTVVFSDGLDIPRAIDIARECEGKIKCSFGVGTNLSNDVGARPLNMVIKMTECNRVPTVKLSDAEGKHTGTPESIKLCKQTLGLE